jgi:hypothetical protein
MTRKRNKSILQSLANFYIRSGFLFCYTKPMIQTNFLAVLVAAIAATVVGFLWYGPLFGKEWSELIGMTPEKMAEAKKKGLTGTYVINFIATLVMAYVLSRSIDTRLIINIGEGLWLSFWIWLGFMATVMLAPVLWQKQSIKLYWINSLGYLVMIWAMTIVLLLFK